EACGVTPSKNGNASLPIRQGSPVPGAPGILSSSKKPSSACSRTGAAIRGRPMALPRGAPAEKICGRFRAGPRRTAEGSKSRKQEIEEYCRITVLGCDLVRPEHGRFFQRQWMRSCRFSDARHDLASGFVEPRAHVARGCSESGSEGPIEIRSIGKAD